MREVPFYPNHQDEMHCEMSAYASILDYFLHKKLSWPELEKLVGYKESRAAWTIEPLPKMAKMGLDIYMIEPFDYTRYLDEGDSYLHTLYTTEQINWYKKNSNIAEMKKHIPKFQKTINHKCEVASLKDIDDMLAEGRLIFVTVNSHILNGRKGFVEHAILILDKKLDKYIAHDPGPPATPFREIASSKLLEAMGGLKNTAEVTGFKLK